MYYHQLSSGFDSWFIKSNQSQVPADWKIGLTVVLGLYPIVMLITDFISPLLSWMPFTASMLVGNIISVAVLQWCVMIWLNRSLSRWLMPRKKSASRDFWVTVGIFISLGLMVWVFTALGQG